MKTEQKPKPWVGKLYHAKTDEDGWGHIRDETGRLIICVQVPPDKNDFHTYRMYNTDPTQERVDAILALLNRED